MWDLFERLRITEIFGETRSKRPSLKWAQPKCNTKSVKFNLKIIVPIQKLNVVFVNRLFKLFMNIKEKMVTRTLIFFRDFFD